MPVHNFEMYPKQIAHQIFNAIIYCACMHKSTILELCFLHARLMFKKENCALLDLLFLNFL